MRRRGYLTVKRAVDVLISSAVLTLSSPVVAVAAGAVRLTMGRPLFFVQTRPGLNGQPFRLVKLRTMLTPEQASGAVADDARLTRIGALLRRTSIDELPTLWNVIRGDMSLVGPRPLLMSYLDRYSPEQFRRHEVRPGLTGLAQVAGRNAISWDERLRLDVEYVDTASAWLDLQILVRTAGLVLSGRGVSAEGHSTMPEFCPADSTEATAH